MVTGGNASPRKGPKMAEMYPRFTAKGQEDSRIEFMRMDADTTGMTVRDRDGKEVTLWMNEDGLDDLLNKALDAKQSRPIPSAEQRRIPPLAEPTEK